MILRLARIPNVLRAPPEYGGTVPARMRFLAPDAAQSLYELERETGGLVYTDLYRAPEASLAARKEKMRPNGTSPVERPGYSAHNFGMAVDIDVGATLRRLGVRYPALCELMARFFFACHRRDLDSSGEECWHFSYFGPRMSLYLALANAHDHSTWGRPVEDRILELYGADFKMSDREAQWALNKLGLYHGAADGVVGPLTREAVEIFQRGWLIKETGLGRMTTRTLAVVTAQVEIVDTGPNV